MTRRRKRILSTIAAILLLLNVVAYFHAYRFTHFAPHSNQLPLPPEQRSIGGKVSALLFGVSLPRSAPQPTPDGYTDLTLLSGNDTIAAWYHQTPQTKGTVILCHGYRSNKSSQLTKAAIFESWGYSTLLIDFRGHGNSSGNTCSIGYHESDNLGKAVEYLQQKGEKHIILSGNSMGAATILHYISQTGFQPDAAIIECPFSSMYATTCARFRGMGVPEIPMAGLLVFWGGVQQGFWAPAHRPEIYAQKVTCPTLHMHGGTDPTISIMEAREVYKSLAGPKYMKVFKNAGHTDYLHTEYADQWREVVSQFLMAAK